MSNRKRFLAMMLTIAMVVSTFATMAMPAGAAATFGDVADDDMSMVLDILSGLDVVRGMEPGVFGGELNVTRQQFALFVARIITGTPGFFEHDTEALERVQRTFGDIRDATFATAIEFAYRAGIIQGRSAPVYEDGVLVTRGVFDPNGYITMQEAVAMLLRALGYIPANAQFLVYPTGYLAAATRQNAALLGPHVETPGFDLVANGVLPSQRLTRYDMAMLLFNTLLSNHFERLLVPGGAGVLQNVDMFTPVLANFGMERVVGYVTGVRNYAAVLNIAHEDGHIERLEGTPVLERTTWGDIEIQYLSTERNLLNVITRHTSNRIRTTMEALRLDTDYEPVELLGRKVAVFRHINRADTRLLPSAMVLGARHDVTDYANEADVTNYRNPDDVNNVRELELGIGNGETRLFNQRSTLARIADRDLSIVTNFYRLQTDGTLWAPAAEDVALLAAGTERPADLPAGSTAAAIAAREAAQEEWDRATDDANRAVNSINALGRLIAGHGDTDVRNYRLHFIDNGIGLDGNPQYFYIFQPMQAVFRHTDESGGRIRLQYPAGTGWAAGPNRLDNDDRRRPFNAATNREGYEFIFANEDISSVAVGSAYMVTISGAERRDITVYRQLDVLRTASRLIGRTTAQMRFEGTAANNLFTFNRATGDMAMGAWNEVRQGNLGDTFIVFGDAATSTPYFARRVEEAPGVYNEFTNFAVIVRAPAALIVGNRTVFNARVFDATAGAERTLRIADLDDRANPFAVGDIIGMRNRGDVWDAVVINEAPTANAAGASTTGRATGGRSAVGNPGGTDAQMGMRRFVASLGTANFANAANQIVGAIGTPTAGQRVFSATDALFNSTRTRMTLNNGGGYTVDGATAAQLPLNVAINANTRFVAVSNDASMVQAANGPTGAVAVAEMIRGAADDIAGGVLDIVAVTRGDAANPGAADVVFVVSNNNALRETNIAPRIGIVLPATWGDVDEHNLHAWDVLTQSQRYDIRYVLEYATNEIIRVATTNTALARQGSIVVITEDTAPALIGWPSGSFVMIEASNAGTTGNDSQTGLIAGVTAANAITRVDDNAPQSGINATRTIAGPVQAYSAGGSIRVADETVTLTPGSRFNVLFIGMHNGTPRLGHRLVVPNNAAGRALTGAGDRVVVTRDAAGNALAVTAIVTMPNRDRLRGGDWGYFSNDIDWGPAGEPNFVGPTVPPTTAVTITGPTTVAAGMTINLTATVTPSGAAAATWHSNNPNVATVSAAGVVTGVNAGTATITATSGGITATHVVTVTGAFDVLVAQVTALVDARTADILTTANVTSELEAIGYRPTRTYYVGAASGQRLDLLNAITAANTAIADRDSAALLVAIDALNPAISGSMAYAFVNARLRVPTLPTISIGATPTSIAVGGTYGNLVTQTPAAIPSTNDTTGVADVVGAISTPEAVAIWTSSNDAIATVDAAGVVTGHAVGNVTITLRLEMTGATPDLIVTRVVFVTP